jgi:hypothetical protein
MRAPSPGLVGAVLFAVGIALFVFGIVDVTKDAPSGGLSRKGTGTPWLILIGVGLWIAGIFLFVAGSSGARFRPGRRPTPRSPIRAAPAARPSPPSPSSPPTTENRLDRLERLAALRDSGALTPAEFEAQKARILTE